MNSWRPIETAPSDGWFLGWGPTTSVNVCANDAGVIGVVVWDRVAIPPRIVFVESPWHLTHWMPLPAPPAVGRC